MAVIPTKPFYDHSVVSGYLSPAFPFSPTTTTFQLTLSAKNLDSWTEFGLVIEDFRVATLHLRWVKLPVHVVLELDSWGPPHVGIPT
jgi:hypothetical protein